VPTLTPSLARFRRRFFRYQKQPAWDHETQLYDKFALFTDFNYEFSDATGRCEAMVKVDNNDKEEFRRLVSVDGVDARCFMDFQWGQQVRREASAKQRASGAPTTNANSAPTTDASDARANNRRTLGPASLQLLFCGRSGHYFGLSGGDPPNLPSGRRGRTRSCARPHPLMCSAAHVLGRTCARPHMCTACARHVLDRTRC
jgi:hypothetical protein